MNQIKEVRDIQAKILLKIEAIKQKGEDIIKERDDENKVLDLLDASSERKFVKTKGDTYAHEFLAELTIYALAKVIVNEEDESETTEEVVLDPALV